MGNSSYHGLHNETLSYFSCVRKERGLIIRVDGTKNCAGRKQPHYNTQDTCILLSSRPSSLKQLNTHIPGAITLFTVKDLDVRCTAQDQCKASYILPTTGRGSEWGLWCPYQNVMSRLSGDAAQSACQTSVRP